MSKLCNWCGDAPVAPGWQWTCRDCTFTCPDCKQATALEFGHGDCQACDDCCINIHEGIGTHILYY